MILSFKTITEILNVLFYLLIFFMSIDIGLIYLVKLKKPSLDNSYFSFHRRHGFLKMNILKIIVILILCYLLKYPPLNAGALACLVIVYFFAVLNLSIDFLKKETQKEKENFKQI
jgi:hypothetical protein